MNLPACLTCRLVSQSLGGNHPSPSLCTNEPAGKKIHFPHWPSIRSTYDSCTRVHVTQVYIYHPEEPVSIPKNFRSHCPKSLKLVFIGRLALLLPGLSLYPNDSYTSAVYIPGTALNAMCLTEILRLPFWNLLLVVCSNVFLLKKPQ